MSLNRCLLITDQSHPHLSNSTSPFTGHTTRFFISTPHLFPITHPYCNLPPSLRHFVLYASVCCHSPPSISACFIFISLLSSLPSPLFLSLSERLLILMCLFFTPSLFPLFYFFYLSFTTDLFSVLPTIYTLWVFIPHHPFHSTFSPSVSISLPLFLRPALCSCSVFIYYCSVDNSLLCLQPYSHLSD